MDTSTQALLTDVEAAALCGMSRSGWRGADAAGRIPRSLHIGRCCRWRAEEIRKWIDAGCPPRAKWELLCRHKL